MKTRIHLPLFTATLLAITVSPLCAQIVADGATNTLNNVTNTIAGDVTVGTNGSFTLLMLTNNALLTNSGQSYVGYNAGANSNAVRLNGTNTQWLMSGDLNVGYSGAGNQLVLSNGGAARNNFGYLGRNSTSSNNVVLVAGAGSTWSNQASLVVGLFGIGNRLVITNGGRVEADTSYLGGDFGNGNNEVLVTGVGSFWGNRFRIDVGLLGEANRLVISNGGTAFAGGDVVVGHNPGALNNLLLLSTGALLTNSFDGVLGVNPGANSNTAFLSDLNTRWLMGGNLHVGSNGAFSRLVITNGAMVRDDYGYLGDTTSSSNNEAVVTGPGSLWTNRLGLHVGNLGGGNRLVITNGGVARNLNGLLGLGFYSSSNVAVVTGVGSLWTNEAQLTVGFDGVGNQLMATNGGVVRSVDGVLGFGTFANHNLAVMAGAGSLWTIDDSLTVGHYGSSNQLMVSDGGVVRDGIAYLGRDFFGRHNVAVVTGAGSQWTNNGDLYVGFDGGNNQLFVSNGGVVANVAGEVGRNPGANGNSVFVTGVGSRWMSSAFTAIGLAGSSNHLEISSGGVVAASTGGVVGSSGNYNSALVTGTGSLWTNFGNLFVGDSSSFNELVIGNGGMVADEIGIVGRGGVSNLALVTGPGSLWTNSVHLSVGGGGFFNQLVISNGGLAHGLNGHVGASLGSHSNLALVTGAGSRWMNDGLLEVGLGSAGNRLVVTNGGVVHGNGWVGSSVPGSNNVAVVTGTGSLWKSEFLSVGFNGEGNRLEIRNGGVVRDGSGRVGYNPTSSNNTVVVTGTGSLWTNEFDLMVGYQSSGNQLVVTNGGTVSSPYSALGYESADNSDNLAVVTGVGSRWTSGFFGVGVVSKANRLEISDGGVVSAQNGYVGYSSPSGSNAVLVTGAGSLWTNGMDLSLGYSGAANQLVLSNGGMVRAAGPVTLGAAPTATNNSLVAVGGSVASTGLTLGGFGSRNNSIALLSGSSWDVRGGIFTWGTAGFSDALTIDASSTMTNIGGLKLDENDTAFFLTNAPGGYSLNGFTTSRLRFKPILDTVVVGVEGTNVQLTIDDYALSDTGGIIGDNAPARNNSVLVTGATSRWNNSGEFKVGNNGSFNQLVLNNGAVLADLNGTVGNSGTASNNSVLVTDAGSLWSNSASLFIGGGGSFNQLVLSNGAVARSATGTVGNAANNNFATIAGAGSVWSNSSTLFIGNSGSFNQLVLRDGGAVRDTTGTIGNTGNNNSAMITGPGSLWNNSSDLIVGNSGSFNQLVLGDGGAVRNVTGTVGNTGNNNSATVTGVGSLWTNSSSLFVGGGGSFNQLVVSNGAVARNTTATVGVTGGNNQAMITGMGSFWGNSSDLFIGGGGSFNQLAVNNSGVVANEAGTIGNSGGANGNSVLVAGTGSLWTNNGNLTVGNAGAFNQLVVSNSGAVRNTTGTIGSSGNSNLVQVIGVGSVWSNSSSLLVGSIGTFNRLVVGEGGTVFNTVGNVGNNPGLSGNFVLITGAGSLWTNNGSLTLGSAGSFNQLVVSNGGMVRASGLFTVGSTPVATNNSVLADGGSLASVGLTLGNSVSRNNSIMLHSNSTWNVGGGAFTWGNAGSNDTLAIDATSALTNIGALTLDENNTRFFLTNALDGYSLNGWTTNQFQFKPTGLGPVIVGNSGTNVHLTIGNYTLADTTGTIGNNGGANSNSVVVTGASALWVNNSSLTVGNTGAGNQLVVTNGGAVLNTTATIGGSGSSNVVLVTGTGFMWSNSSSLLVGSVGTFNRLVISEGGAVANTVANVGNNPGLSGNGVLVTGPGSRWNNSSSLTLGSGGSLNQLVVSNGGMVTATSGSLGSGGAANSNLALITGAGSQWTNSAALTIGNVAGLNQLVVSNGATVGDSIGYLGFTASSGTNEAVVTGAGSLWINRSELYIGNASLGNRLAIADGGTVLASNAVYLGFNSTSTSNLLTVGGGGLIVTNGTGSGVLDVRRGTGVLNSGTMDVDRLLVTNSQGFVTFNGGTLRTKGTTNSNGQLFTVGNGMDPATFELVGNGMHTFANGLTISGGASLRGNGTIGGALTVAVGGTLSPGTSVGKIVLNSPPTLQGGIVMEVSKSGALLTNDQIHVAGALAYGGSLTVSNLGPNTPGLGDSFPLFNATSYSGALTALALPALPAGLTWTNRLLVNGSIAVVNKGSPNISSFARIDTNLILNVTGGSPGGAWDLLTTTNVALPLLNWSTNRSGVFDWLGNATLTNGINLTEPQRFFLINAP